MKPNPYILRDYEILDLIRIIKLIYDENLILMEKLKSTHHQEPVVAKNTTTRIVVDLEDPKTARFIGDFGNTINKIFRENKELRWMIHEKF